MQPSGRNGSASGTPLRSAPTYGVLALDYQPGGRLLATADGHSVPLWEAKTGDCLGVIEPEHGAQAIAFSPDGTRLAIGGSRLTIVDPSTGISDPGRRTFPADKTVVWAPDGSGVLSVGGGGWILVHDTPGLAERFRLPATYSAGARVHLAWSPCSSFIATASFRHIDLWDASDGRHLCGIVAPDPIENVALSRDGQEVIGTSVKGTVSFWNTVTGTLVRSFNLPSLGDSVHAMAWSANFRTVAVASRTAVVVAYARNGAEVRRLHPRGANLYTGTGRVAFSSDGSTVAMGVGHSNPGVLGMVWDLASGDPLWALHGGTPAPPVVLAVAPTAELPPVPWPPVAAVQRTVATGTRAPEGEAVWSRRFRAEEDHSAHDLEVAASGEILLLGSVYHREIDFGPPLGQISVDAFHQGRYLLTMDGDGAPREVQGLRWNRASPRDPSQPVTVIEDRDPAAPAGMQIVARSDRRSGDLVLARHLREGPHSQGLAVQVAGEDRIGLSGPQGEDDGSTQAPAGSLERLSLAESRASATVLKGARVQRTASNRDGGMAMTGYFGNPTTLGDVTLQGKHEARFLVKLSPDGQVSYTKALPEGWYVHIALDPSGKLFVAGVLVPGADLGNGPYPPGSLGKLFLAKLDGAGDVMWMHVLGGSGDGGGGDLTITPEGGVLLSGTFTGSLDLGLGPLPGTGTLHDPAPFLARFGPRGTLLWSRRLGHGYRTLARAVRIVDLDHAIVCGTVTGDLDLGAGLMPRSRRTDVFVAKLVY